MIVLLVTQSVIENNFGGHTQKIQIIENHWNVYIARADALMISFSINLYTTLYTNVSFYLRN